MKRLYRLCPVKQLLTIIVVFLLFFFFFFNIYIIFILIGTINKGWTIVMQHMNTIVNLYPSVYCQVVVCRTTLQDESMA